MPADLAELAAAALGPGPAAVDAASARVAAVARRLALLASLTGLQERDGAVAALLAEHAFELEAHDAELDAWLDSGGWGLSPAEALGFLRARFPDVPAAELRAACRATFDRGGEGA
ncbi:MAG: hypothetical protein ACYDCP_07030 [Thermoplasmataceae archaeon]